MIAVAFVPSLPRGAQCAEDDRPDGALRQEVLEVAHLLSRAFRPTKNTSTALLLVLIVVALRQTEIRVAAPWVVGAQPDVWLEEELGGLKTRLLEAHVAIGPLRAVGNRWEKTEQRASAVIDVFHGALGWVATSLLGIGTPL